MCSSCALYSIGDAIHHEYSVQFLYKKDIKAPERVQRRGNKGGEGFGAQDEQLRKLGLFGLEKRRLEETL